MDFYHDLITSRSWELLKKLKASYDFILIGGWAVWLYTNALKSKDVDLVMDYSQLERFKGEFEVFKNERLKKYEAKSGGMDIDIYVSFYSNPGLPAEDLKKFTNFLEGFTTVEKEVLAILKQKALIARQNTVKGRKDLIDLVSLFKLIDFDWQKYKKLVAEYDLRQDFKLIKEIIKRTGSLLELGLNVQRMAQFKRKVFV